MNYSRDYIEDGLENVSNSLVRQSTIEQESSRQGTLQACRDLAIILSTQYIKNTYNLAQRADNIATGEQIINNRKASFFDYCLLTFKRLAILHYAPKKAITAMLFSARSIKNLYKFY